MQEKVEFEDLVQASIRFKQVVPDVEFLRWIDSNPAEIYSKVKMLTSPHWRTLLKAYLLKHEDDDPLPQSRRK